ncbi:hypothetical protein EW145_g4272 [Phellinidium pouzarii]|uniref:Uncharacterized protein n=1 Tax=Phellinidium pouzarii TaxID=167371 RepID=A0A4V3XCK5_9AGAM|nr:hypothetical protein EW145_g4272 [Phellinidium pouzarii]
MQTIAFTATALGSTIGFIVLASLRPRSVAPAFILSAVRNFRSNNVGTAWSSSIGRFLRQRLTDVHSCKEMLRSFQRNVADGMAADRRWWRRGRKDRRKFFAEFTGKNFWKIMRIFKIWEPLPYDIMFSTPLAERTEKLVEEPGYMGVCLRFRKGTLEKRQRRRGPWELENREFSIARYFPLEEDGSLRLSPVRKAFSIEEIEFLVPGRYDPFYASDEERVSALALVNLAHCWNYVTIVEREDVCCQLRRRFRQWLRGSQTCYVLRWICYVAIVMSMDIHVITTLILQQFEPWTIQTLCGAVAFVFGYNFYISIMHGRYGTIRWYNLSQRYTKYWLPKSRAQMFL